MDAGTIIFYLIIIVFIVSRIRRAIKESERAGPEKTVRKSGWKKVLSDVMTEIQDGMETAPERKGEVSGGWEGGWEDIAVPSEYQAQYPGGPPEEAPVYEQAVLRPENPREREPSEKMLKILRRIDELKGRDSGADTPPSAVPVMPGTIKSGPRNPLPLLPDQLQAAVVWSEIIAPPLALREFDR